MSIIQSIILGIVQGITEFLPISSSGHLVIVPEILGWDIPAQEAFIFDILVQVATLVAVFTYFWKDLVAIVVALLRGARKKDLRSDPQARLGWLLILASLPAGMIGLALNDLVERAFSSLLATGVALLFTAMLLTVAERVGKRNRGLDEATWVDAVWIGFAQVLAIFPGVSRSGATITGGMTRNLDRQSAARFSFLMSIPIMLAAGLLATYDLFQVPNLSRLLPVYIPGFISAAITGYLSIRWLLGYLSQRPLTIFAIYCAIVGGITIIFSLIA